jgi:hypothetical protein
VSLEYPKRSGAVFAFGAPKGEFFNMSYASTITDEQARVLRDACELYARVGMGQLWAVA